MITLTGDLDHVCSGNHHGMESDLFNAYESSLRAAGLSPRTIHAYIGNVQHVARAAGVAPEELRPHHIREHLATRRTQSTRWQYYKCLDLWARWLRDMDRPEGGLILAGVRRPVQPECHPDPVSEADYRRVLESDLTRAERAMILLGGEMGLRVEEIGSFRARFDGGFLELSGKGRRHRRPDRVVVPPLVAEIAEMMPQDDWWFPAPTRPERPMSGNLVWSRMRSAMARAGVDARPHQLRHRFATHLVQSGVPLPTVSKMMRHRSIRVTMGYVRTGDDEQRAALEILRAA